MESPLFHFFETDHRRLDALLEKAMEKPGKIDMEYYHQFRKGLLRHIKMEEKSLFPAAKRANPQVMEQLIPQFRLEHGAITALMVPPPTETLVKVVQYVLEKHNVAEEEQGGLYNVCEALTQDRTHALLEQLRATTEVPVRPPNPHPIAMEAAKRALQRAGYDYDEIVRLTQG